MKIKKSAFWSSALLLTILVTGCAANSALGLHPENPTTSPQTNSNPYPYKQLPNNMRPVTTEGVTVYNVGTGQRGTEVWSPTGSHFAFAVAPQKGTAALGTTSPLHTSQVSLGQGRTIVALTDKYAIVSSSSAKQDWLYPIKGMSLGKPIAWTASTDTWQEWVTTSKGPAVITGGYMPGTVGLTFSNGTTVSLHGGQVDTSSDHKYGAVVTRTRMKRVVHPVGNENDPSERQPSPANDAITLWDFDAAGGPHQLSTIQLPSVHLPSAAGKGYVQNIEFSPDDKYLAVLVQGGYGTGPTLTGKTFVFGTDSGKLVGSAPYGDGMLWSADSASLWLGTPMPAGQGTDRMVNVQGKTVWTWSDAKINNMVLPISSTTSLVVNHSSLDVWSKNHGLKSFSGLGDLHGGAVGVMAPQGRGALVDLWGSVVFAKW